MSEARTTSSASSAESVSKPRAGTAERKRIYKVIVVGNLHVGKTSMLLRLKNGNFCEAPPATGVDRISKPFTLSDGETVTLDIWDTAGNEDYKTITKPFYRGAKAAVVVYDLSSSKSVYDLPTWFLDVKTYAPGATIFLVGNKTDLGQQDIEEEVIQRIADDDDVQIHFKVSVKENTGLREVFMAVAQHLHTQPRVKVPVGPHNASIFLPRSPPSLDESPEQQSKQSCSC